jgi:hypothetical protein
LTRFDEAPAILLLAFTVAQVTSSVGRQFAMAHQRRERRLSFAIILNQKSTLFALLDFDDLICDAAVGLTVYGLSRFFARSSAQTKDRTICFVERVMQILHPVLALNRKVTPAYPRSAAPTAWQPPASYQTDDRDPQHRCLQARKLIHYNHKNAEKLGNPDNGIEVDQA